MFTSEFGDYDAELECIDDDESGSRINIKLSKDFLRPAYYGTSQQCAGGRYAKNTKRTHRR